jgi:hypothetical protein
MATVEVEQQRLLIGGEWVPALDEFTELRWITVGGPEGRHYPI